MKTPLNLKLEVLKSLNAADARRAAGGGYAGTTTVKGTVAQVGSKACAVADTVI